MNRSPVMITGIGACTPMGSSFAEIANGLLSGRSFIRRVTGFRVDDQPCQIGGQIGAIPIPDGISAQTFASLPRLEQLALWSCATALRDAGLWEHRSQLRIGLVLGMGGECLEVWEADGLTCASSDWQPAMWDTPLVQRVQQALGLTGPTAVVSAACASGNVALAQGRAWLRLGLADVCLAGACDAALSPLSMAGFGNLRALSRRNHDPEKASRPFDRGRDGFVMSEGATVFLLERGDSLRDAAPYAEIAGYGAASDAYHMVIPSPEPGPSVSAIRKALADAQVCPEDVDYINAHATSTPVGDSAETRVLSTVFGSHLQKIPTSATKSMTGHLLSAASAVEALACIVAMRHRAIPPTINLDEVDPECALCHVPHTAREHLVRIAMSDSFGFGGSNTCLVLRAA